MTAGVLAEPWPLAFYAPLKSPNHPVPSGDRTMARLLMKALERAGCVVELASEHRSLDLSGSPEAQARLRDTGFQEAERLIAEYRRRDPARRPRAWFSYHVYYKAPDWIGPRVSEALGIPYFVAEASRARKRALGSYALGHAGAEVALDKADAVFVMTSADRVVLERDGPAGQRLIDLPPFLDLDGLPPLRRREPGDGAPRLLTVAMMRLGDKLASYRLLAEALGRIADLRWELDVVGDGEARPEIAGLFAGFGNRVRFHGSIEDPARLGAFYQDADLLLWPAVNEAYGMVLLESQVWGCPVLAGDEGGVASVVRHGETGWLTPPRDPVSFADAVRRLLDEPELRCRLGAQAERFVRGERGLDGVAAILRTGLADVLQGAAPCGS